MSDDSLGLEPPSSWVTYHQVLHFLDRFSNRVESKPFFSWISIVQDFTKDQNLPYRSESLFFLWRSSVDFRRGDREGRMVGLEDPYPSESHWTSTSFQRWVSFPQSGNESWLWPSTLSQSNLFPLTRVNSSKRWKGERQCCLKFILFL